MDEPVEFLSREEEAAQIQIAQAGNAARLRLKSGEDLSPEDRAALVAEMARGREAVGVLLHSIGPYIRLMASRWYEKTKHRWSFSDCEQAGSEGAMHAIRKFDPTTGTKLITYATWWIYQALGRMRQDADVIHRPQNVRGWQTTKSLDVPMGNDADGATLATTIESRDGDVIEEVARREAAERLKPLLKVLPERTRTIMLLRYRGMTLEEVGAEVGVSRERVRQIEARALVKLKIKAAQLGMVDDCGRERITQTRYECPLCGGHETNAQEKNPRRWYCSDCSKPFTPEELQTKPPPEEPEPAPSFSYRPDRRPTGRVQKKPVTERRVEVESEISKVEEIDAVEDLEEPVPAVPVNAVHQASIDGYQSSVVHFRAGRSNKDIERLMGVSAPIVKKYRALFEAENGGPAKCPCGRDATHKGPCKFRSNNPVKSEGESRSAAPRKVRPSEAQEIIHVNPEPPATAPSVTDQLRSRAQQLEEESERMRSQANDLREAARLIDRAQSS